MEKEASGDVYVTYIVIYIRLNILVTSSKYSTDSFELCSGCHGIIC